MGSTVPHLVPLFFSLCTFHALVVARHRFGAQGWSRHYSFGAGDLVICSDLIVEHTETHGSVVGNEIQNVPWADLRYLIGEIMYGGHITDRFDRRVCNAYLANLLD